MSKEFDLESFQQLSPEAQTLASQMIFALKQATAIEAVSGNIDAATWGRYNTYLGEAGNALTALSLADSVSRGDYEQAAEDAGNWVAGEMLSKGFGDVVQASTQNGFASQYGFRSPQQAFHKIWSQHMGGLMADATIQGAEAIAEFGEALKDAVEYNTTVRGMDDEQREILQEYRSMRQAMAVGGVAEYAHFKELGNSFAPTADGELNAWSERPHDTNFHNDLTGVTDTIANTILQNPLPDARQGLPIFGTTIEGIDEMSDVIRLDSNDGSVEFSLDQIERLEDRGRSQLEAFEASGREDPQTREFLEAQANIGLDRDVESYISRYGINAEQGDGRDINFRDLSDDTRDMVRDADYLQIELADPSDSPELINPQFNSGRLDASDNDGGTVMIGRDGGRHIGSAHDDVSLDGSNVSAGAGDDVVVLDVHAGAGASAEYVRANGPLARAFGGDGNDAITGGLNADQLHGGRGEDILNGDKGDDVLYGTGRDSNNHSAREPLADDGVRDIMTGGAGRDIYHAGDNDVIQATVNHDKADVINFAGITLQGPDGQEYPDGELRGVNGEIYRLSEDGSSLSVHYEDKELTIRDFQKGDFGIDISTTTPSASLPAQGGIQTDPINFVPSPALRPEEAAISSQQDAAIMPATSGVSLYNTVAYMKDNVDSMIVNLDVKSASGEITPREEALFAILGTPQASLVFGALNEAGVDSLPLEIDQALPPETNGVEIYTAVGESMQARGLEVPEMQTDTGVSAESSAPSYTDDHDTAYV